MTPYRPSPHSVSGGAKTEETQVTLQHFRLAHDYYRRKPADAVWVVAALTRFCDEGGLVPRGDSPPPIPIEAEVHRFADYLREARGVAEATILGHSRRLRPFLRFVRFDDPAACLRQLEPRHIEAFLGRSARTNNRFSMQHIVATLRA